MQRNLYLFKGCHGGRRPRCGRKRIKPRGVSHCTREKVSGKTPLHVNFKYRTSIRNKDSLKLLKKAIQNARGHGLRVLHYSLESNHVHLILEAASNALLTQGMRSLTITMAKGLGLGRVQIERYHLHVLKSIREVKHAIHYVLFTRQRHEKRTYSTIDQYSSVLLVKNALELIKKFAQEKNVTLKICKEEEYSLDEGESFLAKKGWSQLF
jgi:REP element-mobilizing transposase RayT